MNYIISVLSNWEFYTRLFSVQSGMEETYGNGEVKLYKLIKPAISTNDKISVSFPTVGKVAATFLWNDKRTLSQIEQMTGYTVKPRGVVSKFKNGGYVVFENNGHGLVAAVFDLGRLSWEDGKNACEVLILNGYSDWRLPSGKEFQLIYSNLCKVKLGGFNLAANYWNSDVSDHPDFASDFSIHFGELQGSGKHYHMYVRAVRTY
jgi:hypothetical protein